MRYAQRTPHRPLAANASLPERLLAARGADPTEQLNVAAMLRPDQLLGLAPAARIILDTIEGGGRICVVGDYDADGATATAIAVRGLTMFGARVSFLVPNRFTDGYGLSPTLVERAALLKPSLIVTVDNGISAVAGVRRAAELGIPVVVTDHHLAGSELPSAVAIVNPNQPGCPFPSKALAGCGVMFYVLIEIRRLLRECGDARAAAPLGNLLDLLALGTVADVVQLDRNNRILVQAGLDRIRSGKSCPAIRHLFRVAGRNPAEAGAIDLGFYIGPRLNAAGRMDDAAVGIQCLITDNEDEAARLAQALDDTNLQRKVVQAGIQQEAERAAETIAAVEGYSLVVANPEWHEGVIGIVAGRLKERFRRPAIVFAATEDGMLKGSARSIPAVHMRDALDAVTKIAPGVIEKFGGHAMAAGLTIAQSKFEQFRDAFEAHIRSVIGPTDLEEVIEHDGPLRAQDLTLENAQWIKQGVWGQGFPAPSFLSPAKVCAVRILKDRHSKLTLDLDGVRIDAIVFNQVIGAPIGAQAHVYARLDINEWNGNRALQLLAERVELAS